MTLMEQAQKRYSERFFDPHPVEDEKLRQILEAGREHSHEHALHSAEVFSRCHPMVVGTGGLTLFPGTPLLEEAERGAFTPLSEKEMHVELKTFVENLNCDCAFITHHTISGANLTGPNFQARKERIVAALQNTIDHGDLDRLAAIRRNKRTL